jgi:hypothetical protein
MSVYAVGSETAMTTPASTVKRRAPMRSAKNPIGTETTIIAIGVAARSAPVSAFEIANSRAKVGSRGMIAACRTSLVKKSA